MIRIHDGHPDFYSVKPKTDWIKAQKSGCYSLKQLSLIAGIIGTGGEIYLLTAIITFVGFIKFI